MTGTTVLFVHHSVGRQLIEEGMLRDRLPGIAVWDHDYNEIGLTDPDGTRTGRAMPVPGDDTDPRGLLALLHVLASGGDLDVPDHDVLVLKSCFPNSDLRTEGQAEELREVYSSMADVARALPQRVLLASSPPLVRESTSRPAARRADELASWLRTVWTGEGLDYVNLFAALSYRQGPMQGTLRARYRRLRPKDSHLSRAGARAGAGALSQKVVQLAGTHHL